MQYQRLMVLLVAVAIGFGAAPVVANSKSKASDRDGVVASGIDCTRGVVCPIIWAPPRR